MNKYIVLLAIGCLVFACSDDDIIVDDDTTMGTGDLEEIIYNPTPYQLNIPDYLSPLSDEVVNSLTEDGVMLGRHLFYDPILSADSTMSCSSCHTSTASFTDNLAFSVGIDGIAGTRSSMSLLNIAYSDNGFFWDGRSPTLAEQALLPVEDPIELHHQWPNLMNKLKEHEEYPAMFRKAFGISDRSEMTKELAASALAQFETILISAQSPYDTAFKTQGTFPPENVLNGYEMFFDLNSDLPDAECGHCHSDPIFSTFNYANNGLDAVFTDLGLGGITGNPADMGKFKIPTLRNIALTAPYMHDGRFSTLEEVIEHYNSGGQNSSTKDPLIFELGLTEENKADLLSFLLYLTDETVATNPAFQNPFE